MQHILFLHIPRTGGGTFGIILTGLYPDNWYKHRGSHSAPKPEGKGSKKINVQKNKKVYFGHFPYFPEYKEYFTCTFIRHPISWTISRWKYGQPCEDSIIDMMDKGFVNMQSKFIEHQYIKDLNFVGITDKYADSIKLFHKIAPSGPFIFNKEKLNIKRNCTDSKNFKISSKLRSEILERNQLDMLLYETALERFNSQLGLKS